GGPGRCHAASDAFRRLLDSLSLLRVELGDDLTRPRPEQRSAHLFLNAKLCRIFGTLAQCGRDAELAAFNAGRGSARVRGAADLMQAARDLALNLVGTEAKTLCLPSTRLRQRTCRLIHEPRLEQPAPYLRCDRASNLANATESGRHAGLGQIDGLICRHVLTDAHGAGSGRLSGQTRQQRLAKGTEQATRGTGSHNVGNRAGNRALDILPVEPRPVDIGLVFLAVVAGIGNDLVAELVLPQALDARTKRLEDHLPPGLVLEPGGSELRPLDPAQILGFENPLPGKARDIGCLRVALRESRLEGLQRQAHRPFAPSFLSNRRLLPARLSRLCRLCGLQCRRHALRRVDNRGLLPAWRHLRLPPELPVRADQQRAGRQRIVFLVTGDASCYAGSG